MSYSVLPTYLAWEAFGVKNGTHTLKELEDRIRKYRLRNGMGMENPQIGCIILTDPFYLEEKDWIPVPEDWSNSIVSGKRYDTDTASGRILYETVQDRIGRIKVAQDEEAERYTEGITKHRIGQGGFRITVTDAYQRTEAIRIFDCSRRIWKAGYLLLSCQVWVKGRIQYG